MENTFQVEKGQRIIVATTPRFPTEIQDSTPGYINYEWRRSTRFDARKKYVQELLHPYRWLDSKNWSLQANQAYDLHNAEAFYPQDWTLTWYGINNLINYSDDSGPWNRAIHQYPQSRFFPTRVLGDMLWELSSWTWASSDQTTLAMFLIANTQFRNRILDLINLHASSPIVPEVREEWQVHILRLWTKESFESLMKKIWVKNTHEQEDMVKRLQEIPYTGSRKITSLLELFPEFNLWNLDELYYPVAKWNEENRKNGWHMEVKVNYQDISNSVLVIRSIKKEK